MAEKVDSAAPVSGARGGVLRDPEFLRFWTGETVSVFGMEVTRLVFPLVAILTLGASSFQVGLLNALLFAPVVFLSLFIGVWLDRHTRRPILVTCNIARALLLAMIPLASATSTLTIEMLYVIVFLAGTLTVIFDVATLSYLPSLVERRHLAEANGRIQVSFSAAGIAGPSLGGVLVGIMTAPFALLVNVFTLLFSAGMLSTIRKPEPPPQPAAERPPVGRAIKEGLRTVFASAMLRNLLFQSSVFNLVQNAMVVVFLVYAVRGLGLTPGQLGVVLGSAAAAALISALLVHRITAAVGLGKVLRLSTFGACLAPLLLLVPRDNSLASMAVLIGAHAVMVFSLVIWNVNTLTVRQIVTPNRLLARMNASYRMFLFGTIPVGALAGGALGESLGAREALTVVVVMLLAPIVWTFFSPVFRLARMPDGPDEDAAADAADAAAADGTAADPPRPAAVPAGAGAAPPATPDAAGSPDRNA
jgi:MFS family permease